MTPRTRAAPGCSWFDGEPVAPAEFPRDLEEDFRLPELAAELSGGTDAPDFQDACLALDYPFTANDYRFFDQARRELGYAYPDNRSQLLGWPDIIQNNMTPGVRAGLPGATTWGGAGRASLRRSGTRCARPASRTGGCCSSWIRWRPGILNSCSATAAASIFTSGERISWPGGLTGHGWSSSACERCQRGVKA